MAFTSKFFFLYLFVYPSQKKIVLGRLGRADGQLLMQPAVQSVRNFLLPAEDTIPNRVFSFMADRIYQQDVEPKLSDVRFYLWTRYNPDVGMRLFPNRPDMLTAALYDPRKPLKVIVHGFGGNGTKAYPFTSITVDGKLCILPLLMTCT